jgi:hypothetical protein
MPDQAPPARLSPIVPDPLSGEEAVSSQRVDGLVRPHAAQAREPFPPGIYGRARMALRIAREIARDEEMRRVENQRNPVD